MSPLLSNTTPDPEPELVDICTTDGSTRLTTCSYCCSKEEAGPAEAAGDELPVAAPVLLPPALLQAAAVKTARAAPAPTSRRLAAVHRGQACAALAFLVPPGTWLLLA
jgi:hypothetical protein